MGNNPVWKTSESTSLQAGLEPLRHPAWVRAGGLWMHKHMKKTSNLPQGRAWFWPKCSSFGEIMGIVCTRGWNGHGFGAEPPVKDLLPFVELWVLPGGVSAVPPQKCKKTLSCISWLLHNWCFNLMQICTKEYICTPPTAIHSDIMQGEQAKYSYYHFNFDHIVEMSKY